ncbi:MAG: tRNA (adenosine(37)-N6)-dimethylallyltransferase MiaA [Chlorobiaceae bacterium]|nr:tRNA (adenosine(37)-N6)-dimethylallyltransferase MiaA [Chlorobiaceae bacterium]
MSLPLVKNPVLVIVGPTSSGKSRLAFELAKLTGGEIISADSRQIFRELDIGSAKPSPVELQEVRHHFIDEKNIGEPFTAGHFSIDAHRRIIEILERGKPAIVAGGSTLYLQGLLEGFAELPEGNPEIRARLQEEMKMSGRESLYEKLLLLDPEHAATLDPTKTQRLLRSLEIIETTGKRVTDLLAMGRKRQDGLRFSTLGLSMHRQQLYDRINRRTDSMIEAGLADEAEKLYNKYFPLLVDRKTQALRSVGYQELFDYFEGRTGFSEAVALIKQHTRNYAKRQLTFFNNTLSVNWTAAPENESDFSRLLEHLSGKL